MVMSATGWQVCSVERDSGVQPLLWALVEAAAGVALERTLEELVGVAPAADVAGDAAAGADLEHQRRLPDQPREQRTGREPRGEHEVRTEALDRRHRLHA